MPRVSRCSSAVLMLLAMNASAEVYRWVDEHGIVNYGSRPPAGSKARQVDADSARVSVVPSPTKPPATASPEQAALRERLGKLESQLEEERRLRALAQATEADQLVRARADCEAQRRLNCDTDPYGRHEPTVIVSPVRRPILMKSHRSPGLRPEQPAPHLEPSAPITSSVPYRR